MNNPTPWQKRIEDTGQHQIIEQILSRMETEEVEHPDEASKASFDRLYKGLKQLQAKFYGIDIELLSPQLLQQIHTNCNSLNSHLNQYFSSKTVPQLNHAHTQLDALIQNFPFLFIPDNCESDVEYRERLQAFNNSAEGYLGTLNKATQAAHTELKELQEHASSLKSEIAQYKEELDTLKKQNAEISTRQNETFNKSQTQRDSTFSTLKSKVQDEMNSAIEKKSGEFDATLKERQLDAQAVLKDMNEKLEEARRVFHNLGAAVGTGRYQEFANQEAKIPGWLRWGAIFSLVAMFGATLFVIWQAETSNLTWNLFLLRFLTVATLSIPAYYFARESTRHRQKEHQYRKIQLELTSLDPFIEFMEEADKKKIRNDLVNKYFGKEDVPPVDDEQLLTKKDLMDLVSKISKK